MMNRREYLTTAGTLITATALAGCGVEEGENFELVNHDFSASSSEFEFEATVKNISDEADSFSILVELYQGSTILDSASTWFADLPPGVESTETADIQELDNIDNVERYELINGIGFNARDPFAEHDGDQFREKLETSE